MTYITRSSGFAIQRKIQVKISKLIDHNRLPSFPNVLASYLADLCNFDSIIMASYKDSAKPTMVYPVAPIKHSQPLKSYLEKSYVLDPFYQLSNVSNPPSVCRLEDISPPLFKQSEYFKSCYQYFNFVDEINLSIKLDNKICFIITLGRGNNLGSISRIELNRLNDVYPMINSLVQQFWLSQSHVFTEHEGLNNNIQKALNTFGGTVLTPRVQQVSQLILQGHSSKSIANTLNISVGTVKVHRKNIHRRLHTSSQSEVFSLFIQHLNEITHVSDYIIQKDLKR